MSVITHSWPCFIFSITVADIRSKEDDISHSKKVAICPCFCWQMNLFNAHNWGHSLWHIYYFKKTVKLWWCWNDLCFWMSQVRKENICLLVIFHSLHSVFWPETKYFPAQPAFSVSLTQSLSLCKRQVTSKTFFCRKWNMITWKQFYIISIMHLACFTPRTFF